MRKRFKTLGERLRAAREERGLTPEQVISNGTTQALAPLSVDYLLTLEADNLPEGEPIPPHVVKHLSRVLGISEMTIYVSRGQEPPRDEMVLIETPGYSAHEFMRGYIEVPSQEMWVHRSELPPDYFEREAARTAEIARIESKIRVTWVIGIILLIFTILSYHYFVHPHK